MPHPPASQLVRVKTAADMLGKSHAALHRAIKSGTLPHYRTADGLKLVLPADAQRWARQARRGRPGKG